MLRVRDLPAEGTIAVTGLRASTCAATSPGVLAARFDELGFIGHTLYSSNPRLGRSGSAGRGRVVLSG